MKDLQDIILNSLFHTLCAIFIIFFLSFFLSSFIYLFTDYHSIYRSYILQSAKYNYLTFKNKLIKKKLL